jgi:hypothetical protein
LTQCLHLDYLDVEALAVEIDIMATKPFTPGPVTDPAPTDLSDSLDVRLLVTGRLTPTAIPILRDRAALAAVLARADEPRADAHTHLERIAR